MEGEGGGGALQWLRVLSGVNKSRLIKLDVQTRPPPQNQNLAVEGIFVGGGGVDNRVALQRCCVSLKIYGELKRRHMDDMLACENMDRGAVFEVCSLTMKSIVCGWSLWKSSRAASLGKEGRCAELNTVLKGPP